MLQERLLRGRPCWASADVELGQQAAVAPALPQGPWSDAERTLLWDSVPRCLLKLGKAGPHETHFRSLKDMLDAHVLVKVQLNADPSGTVALAQQLVDGCQATLVQVEGRTMLLAQGGKAPAQIVAAAQESLTKIRAYHLKRKNRGAPVEEPEGRAQPSASGPPPPQEGREQRGGADRAGPGANGRAAAGRGPASGRDAAGGRQQRPGGEGSGLDWRQRPTAEGSGARPRSSSVDARRGPGSEQRPRPGADGRQRPGADAAPVRPAPAPAGPSIDSIIASTVTKGSLSKETLQQEWVALAEQIRRQEAQEFGGGKRSALRQGPGPAPGPSSPSAPSHRRASKAPWRKPAAP